MAGSTIGNTLRTASHGKTVVAVSVGRNTIGGQVVTQRQAFIAVASSASGHRDAPGVHQRSLLFWPQDQVLPVAIAAHRGTGYAGLHGLPVYAFNVGLGDVGVALSTGCGNIPVVDFGTGILRGKDAVAPVTIRAACGSAISIHHRSSVHALSIEFDGMREWNLVT